MNTAFYTSAAQSFTQQEAKLASLQQELASGTSVPTAGTNPAAYIGAQADASTVQQLSSLNASQVNIQETLGSGTSALGQTATALDQIQSIALQAINGTTNSQDFQALGQQVSAGLQQIIGLANTQSSNGNYVFSGTAKQTQPFVETASGSVGYVGNNGTTSVEISPGVSVNAALSGSVFTSALSGNGYASVAAGSGNTGAATVLATGVATSPSATAFQEGNAPITLSFSNASSGGTIYTAKMGGTTIGSGPVNDSNGANTTVTLQGIEFQVSGQPASGDSFTISPARPQSVFALVSKISAALHSPGITPASVAQTRQVIGNALGGIIQYQNQISAVSAKAGVIVQAIGKASTANSLATTNAQTNSDTLIAANVPKVITQIESQTAALQAAMKAFSSAAQSLSVFNYI